MSGGDKQVRADDGVSTQEEKFLYHVVSGLSLSGAARAAGYNFKDFNSGGKQVLKRAPVKARLAQMRAEAAQRARISQDDVIEGFKSAIGDAQMLSDPQAQIAGWREIAKMLGFYAPEVKRIEISSVELKARQELAELSEKDLLEMAGDDGAIEGEFNVLDG